MIDHYQYLTEFAERIRPYYLARKDEQLDAQRPAVSIEIKTLEMCPAQTSLYLQAEGGALLNQTLDDLEDVPLGAPLYAHAFQATAAPELTWDRLEAQAQLEQRSLKPVKLPDKGNAKLEFLRESLEGDLQDQPVLIFSPYRTVIEHYAQRLQKQYDPALITGAQSPEERAEAQRKFQSGETNLCLVTAAGSESLNLQRGKFLLLLNLPYDPGTYLQLLGRLRRYGSLHERVIIWLAVTIQRSRETGILSFWGYWGRVRA